MKRLGLCLSCDGFFELTAEDNAGLKRRCSACSETLANRGKHGSLIVVGVLSQRELAKIKREFFSLESTVRTLEERRQSFIQQAIAQAEQMVKEVEAVIGQPVKELRDRRDFLRTKLQEYMKQSGNTEIRIRNLLLELKNEVVNPGNRPQPTKIYEELRKLAGLTEDELREIIRANYSEPQFGDVLHVTQLPSGRPKSTASYDGGEMDLPKLAEIEKDFAGKEEKWCRIASTEGTFFLTGDFVRKNGLAHMVSLQRQTKASTKVVDVERRPDGSMLILAEGPFVSDPNTLRSFLADMAPGADIADVLYPTDNRVAVELIPAGSDPTAKAMGFFDQMESILGNLMEVERARSQVANGVMEFVTGANQMDLGDNVDDLSLKYERQVTNPSGTGSSGVPQEGIMQPEKGEHGSPMLSTGDCNLCFKELTANNRDPIDGRMCIWCGLESEERV